MILQAYAKINLGIDVLDKRDDDYHNIDIVSIPLELHDSLEIFEIPQFNSTYITSDDPTLVCDENNLAYKALNMMKKSFEFKRSYRIHIYKRIPTEAGLGGGSADAGAVIRVMCKLLKLDPNSPEILEIARKVGSDVPFSVLNVPSRLEGMGEKLTPINLAKSYYVLLVKPNKGLSTKAVFDEYDNNKYVSDKNMDQLIQCLENKDVELTKAHLYNALEKPAIHLLSEIKDILNQLNKMGLKLSGMSGSGSCCYALSNNKKELEEASEIMKVRGYSVYLTSFLNHDKFLKKNKTKY